MATRPFRNPDRVFFAAVASVALAIPFVGFAPTYYLKGLFDAPSLSLLVHIHAALFTAWPVLLLTQALLIRAGNVQVHRALGTAAIALVALMVLTGFLVVIGKPRPTVEARAFIFTPLLGLVLFAAFFAVAVRWRRDLGTHKRLLLLATLFIVPAGMIRILRFTGGDTRFYDFASYALVLVPLAIYDLVRLRRVHPATLWGGAVLVLRHPVHAAVAYTDQWQRIAAWLTASG
jgi:hypothetical protein